jgi:hypothetical protein
MNAKIKSLLATTAIATGLILSCGYANAQQMAPPAPGYGTYGYAPENMAAHHGYNDGYDKAISDRTTGHSYRPTSDHYYNHPIGYPGGPMSKHEYDRIYREAFLHGYERGYRNANNR